MESIECDFPMKSSLAESASTSANCESPADRANMHFRTEKCELLKKLWEEKKTKFNESLQDLLLDLN